MRDPAADLCDAASRDDISKLRTLVLDHELDPGAGDYDRRTALHLAASEGRIAAVTCLVDELHADPNPVDRWGGTPLDDARRQGHAPVVRLLNDAAA